MGRCIDLVGMRFGAFTVIQRNAPLTYSTEAAWLCKCDCGNLRVVKGSKLRSGRSKSCGCLQSQQLALFNSTTKKTHGKSNTRLYGVWRGMHCRCYQKSHNRYKDYGGRGITICAEWLHDFQAFHDWAIANGYDENATRGKCTIDRINNDGNYEPSNCRWVDMKAQLKNQRKVAHYE